MNNSLNTSVRTLKRFLEKEVASRVLFKVPAKVQDSMYQLEVANPEVNLFEVKAQNPEDKKPRMSAPQIVIQVLNIEDKPFENCRELAVQLVLVCWNPGIHGNEFLIPKHDQSLTSHVFTENTEGNTFKRTYDGWKDVYSLMDMTLEVLQSQPGNCIGDGIQILLEEGIQSGPFRTDTGPIDSHPYYLGWIEFYLRVPIIRPNIVVESFDGL